MRLDALTSATISPTIGSPRKVPGELCRAKAKEGFMLPGGSRHLPGGQSLCLPQVPEAFNKAVLKLLEAE
jgi:hypothetical protein